MQAKFNVFQHNHTWDLVPKSQHYKVIGCRWLHNSKTLASGEIDKRNLDWLLKDFFKLMA